MRKKHASGDDVTDGLVNTLELMDSAKAHAHGGLMVSEADLAEIYRKAYEATQKPWLFCVFNRYGTCPECERLKAEWEARDGSRDGTAPTA